MSTSIETSNGIEFTDVPPPEQISLVRATVKPVETVRADNDRERDHSSHGHGARPPKGGKHGGAPTSGDRPAPREDSGSSGRSPNEAPILD